MRLIGSPGGLPLPAPTPPYMRVRVRRFLAVLYGLSSTLSLPRWSLPGSSANRLHRSGTRPPMVVSACQVQPFPDCFTGSYLPVLWPLLTPVLARRSSRTAPPFIAEEPGAQASLSKNVNSCCTTGPFISGVERRAALCRASSPAPSTLYGLGLAYSRSLGPAGLRLWPNSFRAYPRRSSLFVGSSALT